MGLAYERSVGFRKDFHAHDRPMILLTRGSCVMRVRTAAGDRAETHTISSAIAFVVPSRVEHEEESVSSIFDSLALFPSPSLVTDVADDEGIPRASVARLMGRAALRRGNPPTRQALGSGDTVTGRAVRYIEASLFSDLPLAACVVVVGAFEGHRPRRGAL